MVWFKVDDGLPSHRKVMAIPRRDRSAAIGLWTLAGAWCAHELTDGHVPEHMLEELASSKRFADLLVRVGLWETTDDGYLFHDWSPIQPTRAEVLAKREEEAARKAEWRARRAAARRRQTESDETGTGEHVPAGHPPDTTRDSGVSPGGVTEVSRSTRTRPVPDPVSPNGDTPSLRSGAAQQRGTRLPDDFVITDEMRAWAHEQGWADRWIDAITERFSDYWRARAGREGVKLDWPATWRNWLRREAERSPQVTVGAGGGGRNPWDL